MKPDAQNGSKSQSYEAQIPYQEGENPEQEAWFTAFFIENHLDHFCYPDQVAPPEQVRFMVYADEEDRYHPCSDQLFGAIMSRNRSEQLQLQYRAALSRVLTMIDRQIEEPREKAYLEALIRIKFQHETRDEIMLPSRLEKRLIRIFINRTQIEDPWAAEKASRNHRAAEALYGDAFQRAMNRLEIDDVRRPLTSLKQLRAMVRRLELLRLLNLSTASRLWLSDESPAANETDDLRWLDRPLGGNGVGPLLDFLGVASGEDPDGGASAGGAKRILWLADESGEIVADMAIIRYVTQLGHKVVVALKEGPLYGKVGFSDLREDQVLKKEMNGALLITEKNLGKNDLAKILRSENHILIISDGTREELNLLLASATFARVFKEVDAIVSRGEGQRRRFFETHFQFTQDVFNICAGADQSVVISHKPKHPRAVKFSHADLEQKAQKIIDRMTDAKRGGATVVFYSGIIGSIPGKIKIAKRIMTTYVTYLKSQLEKTFIINPSEHFEPGMDADDLMYMWEIVQTSGLIDIWRFQSYGDIFQAFQIMEQKVPPEWVGKDATYSTGCTKEMNIALRVQKTYPEMQIIGPGRDKFIRRKEYGIGKMYDRRLAEIEE